MPVFMFSFEKLFLTNKLKQNKKFVMQFCDVKIYLVNARPEEVL